MAMAIVTSALTRDDQNYVFGTARPDLTKDLNTLLSTYDAGSACNPVVPYLCRQTSTMADKASKGKGISKRERLWSGSRRSLRARSGRRRRRESFWLSLRERERERYRQKKKTEEMSWLRSAISKAAEVGNKTNISRTAKTFADAVLQQAAGGAKIVQDRLVRPLPLLSLSLGSKVSKYLRV